MNIVSFINTLLFDGVKISISSGKLKLLDCKHTLTNEQLDKLEMYKDEIMLLRDVENDSFHLMPLSEGQKAMWVMHQFSPNSPSYNTVLPICISSEIDVDLVKSIFQELINRHDLLKANFISRGQDVVQLIPTYQDLYFEVVNVSGLTTQQIKDQMEENSKRPFDLKTGPLFRVSLFKYSPTKYYLMLVGHHIITDAWSYNLILSEFLSCYQAKSNGKDIVLPPIEHQYDEFAIWQKKLLNSEAGNELLTYWKNQLGTTTGGAELPTDFERPAVQKGNGGSYFFALKQELIEKVLMLAKETGNTLFHVLLATYMLLIKYFTNKTDIVVGIPATGRTQSEYANTVGYFINAVVIKYDFLEEVRFDEYLHKIKGLLLEALKHQDYPYAVLIEQLNMKYDPSRLQLLQNMFLFIDDMRKAQKVGGTIVEDVEESSLNMESFEIPAEEGQNDIILVISKMGHEFQGIIRYDKDLFKEDTIKYFAESYCALLEEICKDSSRSINEYSALPIEEKEKLLYEWNDTNKDYPKDSCFKQLFEEQVLKSPNKLAVKDEKNSWTYEKLNRYANEIAYALVERGIGPERIVCILDERSCSFLATIIGVFKAGGAYIPLNPKHPNSRHAQIIHDSGAAVVVTSRNKITTLQEELQKMDFTNKPVLLCIEDLYGKQTVCDNLDIPVAPHHLAYVIYTSGSTGLPKGAMVEQFGMINHLYAKINDLNMTSDDIVAQNASQCFDISVWQYLAVLLVGGSVYVCADDLGLDPSRFIEVIHREKISILEMVPSLLQASLDIIAVRPSLKNDLNSLRWMIATGEALPPKLCRRWLKEFPQIPMLNAYGPTECSDDVSHYAIYEMPSEDVEIMPIGYPIQNTSLYILDDFLNPVPTGVIGELYVGGNGVGRGYLNDETKTNEVFMTNPFTMTEQKRLYKTGDLACFLKDGCIEYHGRKDYQVKIRGFRIELGEIEATMRKIPAIKDAVVVVRGNQLSDKVLTAFWIGESNTVDLTTQEITDILHEKLPEYMIPTKIIRSKIFPLSGNGKIDRKALMNTSLSELERTLNNLVQDESIERDNNINYIETMKIDQKIINKDLLKENLSKDLVQVINNILNTTEITIGAEDNLIENGFNSVLFITLSAMLEEKYQIRIAPMTFFEYSTISKLTDYLLKEYQETFYAYYEADCREDYCEQTNLSQTEAIQTTFVPEDEIKTLIKNDLNEVIKKIFNTGDENVVSNETNLIESGFNSVLFITLSAMLEEKYQIRIAPMTFFEYPTINKLTDYLMSEYQQVMTDYYNLQIKDIQEMRQAPIDSINKENNQSSEENNHTTTNEENLIAVVGMSGKLSGAENLSDFWDNLVNQKDVIREVPNDRWNYETLAGDHSKSRLAGYIDGVDQFDAEFFGITDEKAELMDPQQRLFLQCVWQTIEDAGYKLSELNKERVGVFVAAAYMDYLDVLRDASENLDVYAAAGMEKTLIPNIVSHNLDLIGPSEAVDTACSSSLVALKHGIEAIRNGECDATIVGATNLILSPRLFSVFEDMDKLSHDGKCKTFDNSADGYVRAEGVMALMLKPLHKAIEAGDNIYAVIRDCSARHVGKAGAFTAPKAESEAELLQDTYERLDIDPASISYIETHGAGLKLIDAIEVNSIKMALQHMYKVRKQTPPQLPYCGIGSVKSNIGHLEAASGMASLLKVILSLKHKMIPGNMNLTEQNEYIDLEHSPLYIVDQNRYWEPLKDQNNNPIPRRAGISSFGGGGVIAHAIVEEYENSSEKVADKTGPQIIILSAKKMENLKLYARQLAKYIKTNCLNLVEPINNTTEMLTETITNIVKELGTVKSESVDLTIDISTYGINTISALKAFCERLNIQLNLALSPNYFFELPVFSINELTQYLYKNYRKVFESSSNHLTLDQPQKTISLERIAYTLQVGREEMPERIGMVVTSIEELYEKLNQFVEGNMYIDSFYTGSVVIDKQEQMPLTLTHFKGTLEECEQLLKAWLNGRAINWKELYTNQLPIKVSLPTYPFIGKKYWAKKTHRPRLTKGIFIDKNEVDKNVEEPKVKCPVGGVLSLVGNTPLLKLNRLYKDFNLYAKLEMFNPGKSMKDRTSLNMVKKACESGKINSNSVIIESSSGNLAVGLAQVCSYLKLRLICVVDKKTNKQTIDILRAYGAEVDIISEPDPETGEYLHARIKRVKWLCEHTPNSFCCNQYANPNNPQAFHTLMSEVVAEIGTNIDYLFVAVSTCGTLRGCYEYIKEHNLKTKIIAVDAKGSVLFSKKKCKRLIPGHGAARVPELFKENMEDSYVEISDMDCVEGCRRLLKEESLMLGGSSGGIITAIDSIAHTIPKGANCLAIFADSGERYIDTIYSDEWVEKNLK